MMLHSLMKLKISFQKTFYFLCLFQLFIMITCSSAMSPNNIENNMKYSNISYNDLYDIQRKTHRYLTSSNVNVSTEIELKTQISISNNIINMNNNIYLTSTCYIIGVYNMVLNGNGNIIDGSNSIQLFIINYAVIEMNDLSLSNGYSVYIILYTLTVLLPIYINKLLTYNLLLKSI